jgi:hypothetical protein
MDCRPSRAQHSQVITVSENGTQELLGRARYTGSAPGGDAIRRWASFARPGEDQWRKLSGDEILPRLGMGG